jgi:hypothetical protein
MFRRASRLLRCDRPATARSIFKDELRYYPMDEDLLREISNDYLVPFFSGAKLEDQAQDSSPQQELVSFRDPVSIAFKAARQDDYRLILKRSQPFAKASRTIVPEIAVVRAFINVVAPMADALASPLKHDLLSTFSRRVVAKAMSTRDERETTLLAGIDQLARWSSRQYEGSAISAAIGFRHQPQGDDAPTLHGMSQHDFSAVVSNGHDTLLEFDFAGRLISHIALSLEGAPAAYCPFRQTPIADWTTEDPRRRRVALCLNRGGEILVFRDGQMLFVRRSGRWSFLTHEPVLTQMGTPYNPQIRKAIYETCLDASFARTGACIGVVSSSKKAKWSGVVVNRDDHVQREESVKAKAIARMIENQQFHKLDRRLRQELVAVDGATVLSHDGDILAVGAILKIPGGSTSGGRLAAAKALSALGLGVKVSQDGGIVGYRPGRREPAFQVM